MNCKGRSSILLTLYFVRKHAFGYFQKSFFSYIPKTNLSGRNDDVEQSSKNIIADAIYREVFNSYQISTENLEPLRHYLYKKFDFENASKEIQTSVQHRIEHLYLPIYSYFNLQLSLKTSNDPLFIGISAPQGCGKSTLVSFLQELFELQNKSCVVLSLDDYYLTGEQQEALASQYPNNPLLRYRGNAGSHDVSLMLQQLQQLKSFPSTGSTTTSDSSGDSSPSTNSTTSNNNNEQQQQQQQRSIKLVQYDKSKRNGRGDRSDEQNWIPVSKKPDIVLVEGWMLGFSSQSYISNSLLVNHPGIVDINNKLRDYVTLHELFDTWLVLAVQDVGVVFEWRQQAEREMRNRGKPGMTDEQVQDFILRFLPAYELCLPELYSSGPQRRRSISNGINITVPTSSCNDNVSAPKTADVPVLEVQDFILRFLPAYELCLPELYSSGPQRRRSISNGINITVPTSSCNDNVSAPKTADVPVLEVKVNRDRLPISARFY